MTPSQRKVAHELRLDIEDAYVVDHNKRLCPKDVRMGIQYAIEYIIDNCTVTCND